MEMVTSFDKLRQSRLVSIQHHPFYTLLLVLYKEYSTTMKVLLVLFLSILVGSQGQDFGSELSGLDFGNIIGSPLLACIKAQVST
jgi:hypothetical protein